MSLMRRALEGRMPVSGPDVDIAEYSTGLKILFGGASTHAGVTVTESTAESLSAVYACVGLIADSIAQVPCKIVNATTKEPATAHPLYSLLHDLPNPEMTAFDLRQTLVRWLLLWGNAYAQVVRDGSGRVAALWPLRSDCMTVERVAGAVNGTTTLRYTYRVDGAREQVWYFDAERPPIHHLRINALDGVTGRSPIRLLRESLGLTRAAEEFGARWFGSGSRPSGVLSTDQRLNPEGAKRMRDDWERLHAGMDNAHRVAVFESGLKWYPITVPPEDAQFLETRNFQVEEIAGRIYRIPPYAIGHTKNSTSWGTGIESQKNGLVTFTLLPYFTQLQQAIKRDLMGRREFEGYDVVFVLNALQRGDLASRMNAYVSGLNSRIYTVNEVRDLEDLPPIPGGDDAMPFLSTMAAARPTEPAKEPV